MQRFRWPRSGPGVRPRLTRRRGVVAVLVVAVAAVLGVFGGSAGASGSKIHLTMWQQWGGGHEEAELQAIINAYEKLHPNVTITQTPVTNDAKVLASIVGGNPPDIIDLGTSLELGAWASQGALQPLGSMVAAGHLNLNVYNQQALEGMKVSGKLYALPFQSFDIALLYNKQLFARAHLKAPSTFAQLNSDAIKLTKQSKSGTITQMGFVPDYPGPDQGQTCPLESYGWMFGGQWASKSGKDTPDTAASVDALTWEKHFYTHFGAKNVSNFVSSAGAYLTSGDPFESGKLAMMYDGPWTEQYIKANNPKLAKHIGVVKFPAPNPANDGTTFLDSNPQIIPRGAQNAQAAFDFIAWETSTPSVTAKFANTVANIPQLASVPRFSLEKDKLFDLYVKEAGSPQAHVWPQNSTSSTYATDLCNAQSAALVGGKAPRAALAGIAGQLHQ